MDQTETTQHADEVALRAWDWPAELASQKRSMSWLARRTDVADMTVYRYRRGESPTPLAWLRSAALALNVNLS